MTAFRSTVELRLNASSDCAARKRAIVSERNPQRAARVGNDGSHVARTVALTVRHKRASTGYFFAVREGSSPAIYTCALSCQWRGAFVPMHIRDALQGGADIVGKQ